MKDIKKKTSAKNTKKSSAKKEVKTTKVIKEEKIEVVKETSKPKVTQKVADVNTTSIIKWSKLGILGVGVILFVIGFFTTETSNIMHFSGISLVALSGIMSVVKCEKYALVKALGILTGAAILITWFIPNATFNGAELMPYEVVGVGLTDLATMAYYSIYFALDKIIFIFMVALFYGVLSNVESYNVLTSKIANKLKDKKLLSVISSIVVLFIFTSLFSQTLMVVLFIPFIIAVLSKMNIDKTTAFMVTFGAMLAGLIGVPYGSEGLQFFTQYTSIPFLNGFEYRLIIALASLALFVLFTVLRMKAIKDETNLEVIKDPFEIKEEKEKINIIPISVVLGITAVLAILGFINWQLYFETTVFADFHIWLLELSVGETAIFARILGSTAAAFGTWDLLIGIVLTFVMSILIAFVGRVKFSSFIDGAVKGLKIFAKSNIVVILVFVLFIVSYITPFMASIADYFFGLTVNLEPNLTSIVALISSVFHPDLGYTGYIVGPYVSTMYVDHLSVVSVIFSSMYGIVQIFAPTSIVLVLGLIYTKVSYKEWLKTIWMFAVGIFVVVLILVNVLYYIA